MSKSSKTQDDAKKYILRHDLERQMSRLMNALLKEHPEDPKQFLVEYLSTKMTKRQIEEAGLCYIKEKEEEHVKEQDNENVVGMSPTAAAATREDGTQTMNEEEKANQDGNRNELHTATDIGAPTADISAAGMEKARGIEEDEVGAPKEERTNAEVGGAAQVEETARECNVDAQAGETAADTDAAVIEDGAAADTDAQVRDAESLDPPARGTTAAAADAPVEDGGAIIEASAEDGVSAAPVDDATTEVAPAENEEAPPHGEEADTAAAEAGEAAPASAAEDAARDTTEAAATVEQAPPEAAVAPVVDDASPADGGPIEGRPQEDVGEQAAAQDTAEEKGEAL